MGGLGQFNEKYHDLEDGVPTFVPAYKTAGLYPEDTHLYRRSRLPLFASSYCAFVLRLLISFIFFTLLARVFLSQNSPQPFTVPENPTKGVVLSSTSSQDVSWLEDLPSDWDVYRYVMDDPTALLHPPVNAGREAMTYLTYIIDHYDRLPDYVVFVHGHERGWHQPEPMSWRIPTLNLEALERDQYVSFNCVPLLRCDTEWPRMNLTAGYHDLDITARLIPWFYRHAQISDEVPETLSWPDSAQFAVTKAAIRRRSRDWWIRYREPMLTIDPKLELFNSPNYYWGLLHERLWHVAFGMNPNHCPDPNYCLKVQWSNGVLCDQYPRLPIGNGWLTQQDILDTVNCFQNDDPDLDWEVKTISACDIPEYAALPEVTCPFDGWDLP